MKPLTEFDALMLYDHVRLSGVLAAVYTETLPIFYVDESWDEIYAGDVTFWVDGWRITIFNDCDDIDYTDSFVTPEGRSYDYDQLHSLEYPLDHFRYGLAHFMDDSKIKTILKAAARYQSDHD